MIPADPTDSYQVNNIPSWWFEDAQRVPSTDGEEEEESPIDDPGLDILFFLRAESPVVPNPNFIMIFNRHLRHNHQRSL